MTMPKIKLIPNTITILGFKVALLVVK